MKNLLLISTPIDDFICIKGNKTAISTETGGKVSVSSIADVFCTEEINPAYKWTFDRILTAVNEGIYFKYTQDQPISCFFSDEVCISEVLKF
jgi:hypothetical protein